MLGLGTCTLSVIIEKHFTQSLQGTRNRIKNSSDMFLEGVLIITKCLFFFGGGGWAGGDLLNYDCLVTCHSKININAPGT